MSDRNIKVFLFDIGNVLLEWNPSALIDEIFKEGDVNKNFFFLFHSFY